MRALHAGCLLIATLSLGGCFHRGARDDRAQDQNRITLEEIQGSEYQNAFELIQRKRPRWLNTRAHSAAIRSANEVAVYLDGTHLGGPATLRRILAVDMQGAEYLTAAEVLSRNGYNHPAGAIFVTTRRVLP